MKGTRLWQAPGSPIIQGRSRTARPFWEVWLAGAVWAELAVIVAAWSWMLRSPDVRPMAALTETLLVVLLPSMPGCMLGSALGVFVARTMGWRRAWLAGAVVGAVSGWLLAWIL